MPGTEPTITVPWIVSADDDLFRALPGAPPEQTRQIYALLVARHSGLVRWIAASYTGRGVATDELCQVGYVGLMLAIRRFDVERGGDFISFARPTVRGEIQHHFRDRRRWIRIPRRLQELRATLRVAEDELAQSLGRWPTNGELAALLLVAEDEVREALATDETYVLASLDTASNAELQRASSITDTNGDSDHRADVQVAYESVRRLMARLPEREQRLLHLRFVEGKTQTQIGEQLGMSQWHVSRLLARTTSGLRVGMDGAGKGLPGQLPPGAPRSAAGTVDR